MKTVTGETLRPGGLRLTKRAADIIGILPGKRILDCGCGRGATMELLQKEYGADVTGIDPSGAMVEAALKKGDRIKAGFGTSGNIPYGNGTFDIVFSECCLSHSESIRASFREFGRVLAGNGYIAVSDLYARERKEPELPDREVQQDSGLLYRDEIEAIATEACFKILAFEDHTGDLTQLACDIIMKYGSMESFFEAASKEGCACAYSKSNNIKPGYYLLIGKKNS
jgi:arsenite methyltransferase